MADRNVPPFGKRLGLAWQIVRGIMGIGGGRKQGPYYWPPKKEGKPQPHPIDFPTYATEAFNKNSVVYTGIMYKVRTMTSAPLRAYSGTRKEPRILPLDHELQKLCLRPNVSQSWEEFHGYNIVCLNLDGNSYVQLEREGDDIAGRPIAMYPLRPDKVFIVPDNTDVGRKGVVGYVYVPEGKSAYESWDRATRQAAQDSGKVKVYGPDEIIHVKYPNPLDDLDGMGYGLSPQSSLANTIAIDNRLTKFLRNFLERGGVPPFWFSYDVPLDDTEIARLREYVESIYGGTDNWVRPGVLDKGGKINRVGLTLEEMGFTGLDERSETRLLGPQGVPPMVVGTRVGLFRSTYENYDSAREAFWQDTMWPDLRLFEVEFQHYLNTDTEFVMFDMSDVPAISTNIEEQVDGAYKMWQMGTPANIAFDTVGLHMADVPGGDIAYVPVNFYPVNADMSEAYARGNTPAPPNARILAETGGDDTGKALELSSEELYMILAERGKARRMREDTGKALAKQAHIPMAAKEAHQNRVDRIAVGWEGPFEDEARKQLEQDERDLLMILGDARAAAVRDRTTINWAAVKVNLSNILAKSTLRWQAGFRPILQGIMEDQAAAWAEAMGIEIEAPSIVGTRWFDDYTLTFAQNISSTTAKDLSELLQRAVDEGWSIDRASNSLETLFQQYLEGGLTGDALIWVEDRMPQYRREMIARTETMRASNAAAFFLFDGAGFQFKEWIAVGDERTRPAHLKAWLDYTQGGNIGPIPMHEHFLIEGHPALFPLDPALPVHLVANCRCILNVIPFMEGV